MERRDVGVLKSETCTQGTVFMQHLLALFCKRLVRRGALILTMADGTIYTCGDLLTPPIRIRFLNAAAERRTEIIPIIQRSRFLICDIEILRLHYAETHTAWRNRWLARRAEAVHLYDERFYRTWGVYLAASEMTFRRRNMMNFQIQLTKRQEILPTTRSYIMQEKAALRFKEAAFQPIHLAAG